MIGIVGGAGPAAGNSLFQKLIAETRATTDQEHLPVLLWSAPAFIPDRTMFLEGKVKENPGVALGSILLKLEQNDVNVAGIACNTAHASPIFKCIQEELDKNGASIRLLNMIEETVAFTDRYYREGAKIGVLSTTGTRKARLYSDALEAAGWGVITMDEVGQNAVQRAIYDENFGVKATGTKISNRAKKILYGAAERLIKDGAEVLILGCTEIPLVITESEYLGVPVVDSLQILARALIEAYAPDKLRPLNS